MTCHVSSLSNVNRSKVKVTRSRNESALTRCNSAMDSRINFKLGGNNQRGWLNTWHAVYVSRPYKPEAEIWRTCCISDEKKSTKNVLKSEAEIWPFRACAVKVCNITHIYDGIAEIPAYYRKSGSRNKMVTSDFRSEVDKWPFCACAAKICNITLLFNRNNLVVVQLL